MFLTQLISFWDLGKQGLQKCVGQFLQHSLQHQESVFSSVGIMDSNRV